MRKYLLLNILTCLSFSSVISQVNVPSHALGIQQNIHDFNVNLLGGKWTSFDSSLSQTLQISYCRTIHPSWTISAGLSGGFLNNQLREEYLFRQSWASGIETNIQFNLNNGRLMPLNPLIAPYFIFGYQLNHIPGFKKQEISPWVLRNMFGTGLLWRLGVKSALQLQMNIAQELGGVYQTHIIYRLGLIHKLGTGEQRQSRYSPSFEDLDGDGLSDAIDQCPEIAGSPLMMGCPFESMSLAADTMAVVAMDTSSIGDNAEKDTIAIAATEPVKADTVTSTQQISNPEPEIETDIADVAKEADSGRQDVPAEETLKTWYVIIFNTTDEAAAKKFESKASREFSRVKILPQPNGYFRVGIVSGTNKKDAENLLNSVKQQGYPRAGLWKE